jgi:hypothetical protein
VRLILVTLLQFRVSLTGLELLERNRLWTCCLKSKYPESLLIGKRVRSLSWNSTWGTPKFIIIVALQPRTRYERFKKTKVKPLFNLLHAPKPLPPHPPPLFRRPVSSTGTP